ncbi:kelch repeat-containing protein, partial [Corallococcus llansteffanensis]
PLLAALVALACACGQKEVAPSLDLVTAACAGTPPLDGVTHLRFRVSGPGVESAHERVSTVRWTAGDVPALPVGSARVLEVRAYAGAPDQGGPLLSLGRSAPVDVAEGQDASVRVFLRRLGEFAPVNLASSPDTCAAMRETRAGHTATLLPDGRVLFAGGYRPDAKGARQASGTTEVFDPQTGTFSPGPDVGPRAFHTASLLPDGKVLLAGGAEALEPASVQRTARVVDVTAGTASAVEPKVARYQHVAAVDAQGHVLLVGGRSADGSGVFTAEGFDAASGRFVDVPTEVPRVDAAVTVLGDGRTLVVAGGADATGPQAEVLGFAFEGNTFSRLSGGARLLVPRVGASVAMLGREEDGPRPVLM